MKILGIDSSAKSASAAIVENGKILSSFYINTGLTHSQTLMPMIDVALKCADINLNEIGLIAVNRGPGSFTGIRIGVAAAKGLADTACEKCCGISTLESMAYNLIQSNCIACAVMDARCSQVYYALFEIKDGTVTRLTEDAADSITALGENLKKYDQLKIFVGDGADLCYNALKENLDNISVACETLKFQNAVGVCMAAEKIAADNYIDGVGLVPEYLRLPQAERELNKKLKKGE